jgi:predicted nucleic acid-binding protein
VNVAEIYYVVKRKRDVATAQKVINQLRVRAQFVEANEQVAIMAGEIKSENKMALGDAFAVATANLHGATLLTGDPEILSSRTKWKLLDLR